MIALNSSALPFSTLNINQLIFEICNLWCYSLPRVVYTENNNIKNDTDDIDNNSESYQFLWICVWNIKNKEAEQ